MKSLAAALFWMLTSAVFSSGAELPYRDQTPMSNHGDEGEVNIEMATATVRQGERCSVKYLFHATHGSYEVFNWQFSGLLPLPGMLVIYDHDKKYIGNLIGWQEGSRRGFRDDDWTFLNGETWLGKPLEFTAAYVPNTRYIGDRWLPPGTYYVQLILSRAFVAPKSMTLGVRSINFGGKLDTEELCRSNVLKMQILEEKHPFETLEERKIADVSDPSFLVRLEAVEWLGRHKVAAGSAAIAESIDKTIAVKEMNNHHISEVAESALALGQIGGESNLPAVRRACQYLADFFKQQGAMASGSLADLFQVNQGRALLGEKTEALEELESLQKQFSQRMEPSYRKEFEERMQAAAKW